MPICASFIPVSVLLGCMPETEEKSAPSETTTVPATTTTTTTPPVDTTRSTADTAATAPPDLLGLLVRPFGRAVFGRVDFAAKDPFTWIADTAFGGDVMNAMGNVVYDPANHWLAWYDTEDDRITTLDLDTGAVLSQQTVGNEAYGGLAFDEQTDRWLLTHWDGVSQRFGELDPSSGAVTYIGTDFNQPAGTNSAAFDASLRTFVTDCRGGRSLCTVDVDTGLITGAIDVGQMPYGYVFAAGAL